MPIIRTKRSETDNLKYYSLLRNTFENKKDYVILPDTNLYNYPKKSKMKRVRFTSEYSSDKVKLLTKNQLIDIFKNDFLVKDILNY